MPVWTPASRVAAAVMVVGLAVLSASRAAAEWVPWPETGTAGDLSLATAPRQLAFPAMSPGDVGYAAIDLRLVDRPWAATSFTIATDGELMDHPSGITLAIAACTRPWSGIPVGSSTAPSAGPTCSSGARTLLPPTPGALFADSRHGSSIVWQAGFIRPDSPGHLLLSVALPPAASSSDETLMGLTGDFELRVTAEGDETIGLPPGSAEPDAPPAPSPPGSWDGGTPGTAGAAAAGAGVLASTGIGVLGWVLLGIGGVALGVISIARPRRRVS